MKPNGNPDLVLTCLVSNRMLIADCMVVQMFHVSLKRKDIESRGAKSSSCCYLCYICLSLEIATDMQNSRYKLKIKNKALSLF